LTAEQPKPIDAKPTKPEEDLGELSDRELKIARQFLNMALSTIDKDQKGLAHEYHADRWVDLTYDRIYHLIQNMGCREDHVTPEEAEEIRTTHKGGYSYHALAFIYNRSSDTIKRVIDGETPKPPSKD
jgi:ribosome assembly protein YihI (activator of Der GTPase)